MTRNLCLQISVLLWKPFRKKSADCSANHQGVVLIYPNQASKPLGNARYEIYSEAEIIGTI